MPTSRNISHPRTSRRGKFTYAALLATVGGGFFVAALVGVPLAAQGPLTPNYGGRAVSGTAQTAPPQAMSPRLAPLPSGTPTLLAPPAASIPRATTSTAGAQPGVGQVGLVSGVSGDKSTLSLDPQETRTDRASSESER